MRCGPGCRGSSLVETLVAAGVTVVLLGLAAQMLASLKRAEAVAVPMAARVWDRARAAAEIQGATTDGAADLAYFDLQATVAALRSSREGSPGGGVPPTGTVHVPPVVSYGSGVRVGESLSIRGPVTVSDAGSPLFERQVGDAVSVLRTESGTAPLRLGAPFDNRSGRIVLVANGRDSEDAIGSLRRGDVLVVTGRSVAGTVVTALAGVANDAEAVALPTPQTSGGEPVFGYYEVEIAAPAERLRCGLLNTEEAAAGVVIAPDAAVALVDRAAGVVTFYTSQDEKKEDDVERVSFALHRVAGDPASPDEDEVLVEQAAAPLDAKLLWSDGTMTESTDVTAPAGAVLSTVTVAVPVVSEEPGPNGKHRSELLELAAELFNSTSPSSRMTVWFGVFAEPTPAA